MKEISVLTLILFAFVGSFADDKYCEDRSWRKFNNNCYSFEKDRLSYYDAEDLCRSKGAHLVSIHSENENEFILNTGYGGRRWIGLTVLDNNYQWSDGSEVDYKKIAPKKQYVKEKCHIFFMSQGWRPEHCELRYPAICKRSVDNVTPDPLPPITTTADEGNCPTDWLQFGQKCYKFFGAVEAERIQYREAKKACMALGEDHDLVSIHSMEEQAFLVQQLADYGTSTWIGLTHIDSDEIGHISVFGWTDNSRVDFTNWAPGHPKPGTWKYCVRLSYEGLSKGQWLSDYCAIEKYGYICSRPPVPSLPTQPPEPSKCGEGFVSFRNSCYIYYSNPESWQKAEETCVSNQGHLVSVADGFEENFLYRLVNGQSSVVWNGLKSIEKTAIFVWSDRQPLYYGKWNSGQPQLQNDQASCVSMSSDKFEWNATSCDTKLPFVCEVSDETPQPAPEPIIGRCQTPETELIDVGDNYCYHIGSVPKERLRWGQLHRYCMTKGMEMITLSSEHQMKLLITYVWRKTYDFWLSLIRSYDGESFMWLDDSPLNYTNWDVRQPTSKNQNYDCVGFSTESSKWSVKDCSDWLGTICRAKKLVKS